MLFSLSFEWDVVEDFFSLLYGMIFVWIVCELCYVSWFILEVDVLLCDLNVSCVVVDFVKVFVVVYFGGSFSMVYYCWYGLLKMYFSSYLDL